MVLREFGLSALKIIVILGIILCSLVFALGGEKIRGRRSEVLGLIVDATSCHVEGIGSLHSH
jgi:predicted permease